MTVLQFPDRADMPPAAGTAVQTDDGTKVWKYVEPEQEVLNHRTNAVGRWVLEFDMSGGSPGGGGGADVVPYRFDNGTGLVVTDSGEIVVGGSTVHPIRHDIDFDTLPKIENLP